MRSSRRAALRGAVTRLRAAGGLAGALLVAAGCVVNPATGKRQLMVISDQDEIEIGKKADEGVREESAIYSEIPELRRYVGEVGASLAAQSDRPELAYRFEIVDSPAVNAFALPGGFIYINRGLLERMNSEDELAAVLGHEIAHVAARHGAAQMSKAYAAQFGMIGVAVFSDPRYAEQVGQLSGMALQLAFQGYSREHEREADDFGTTYAKRAGYNPRGVVDLLRILDSLEKDEPSRVEMWFASHPQTSERIQNVRGELADLERKHSKALDRPIRRDPYLRRLDGLALGLSDDNGYVAGKRFVSKKDLFSVDIPEGWSVGLGKKDQAVVLARVQASLRADIRVQGKVRKGDAGELAQEYARRAAGDGLQVAGPVSRARLPAGIGGVVRLRGTDKQGKPISVRKLFLERLDRQMILTFVAPLEDAEATEPTFQTLTGSIRHLNTQDLSEIPEPRLRLHTVAPGETWGALARTKIGEGASGARLASYNGYEAGKEPEPGLLIKVPSSTALGAPE